MKAGNVTMQTAARLAVAHPEVPAERMPGIVGRTFLGAFLALIGLVLTFAPLYVGLTLLLKGATPPTTVLIGLGGVLCAGLFFLVLGAVTASGKLLRQPLALVSATVAGIRQTMRK